MAAGCGGRVASGSIDQYSSTGRRDAGPGNGGTDRQRRGGDRWNVETGPRVSPAVLTSLNFQRTIPPSLGP